MEDGLDIPEDSMRHIEALLARHRPEMIQRMFQQALEGRTSSSAAPRVQQLTQPRTQLGRVVAHFIDGIHRLHRLVVSFVGGGIVPHVHNLLLSLASFYCI